MTNERTREGGTTEGVRKRGRGGWKEKFYRSGGANCWDSSDNGRDRGTGRFVESTGDSYRFWGRVDKRGPVGPMGRCWLWTGSTSADGYGRFWAGGRMVKAHRWAWEQENGPVPEGLTLDHECHNAVPVLACPPGRTCCHRACVRPSHLEPVTDAENRRRARARRERGQPRAQRQRG